MIQDTNRDSAAAHDEAAQGAASEARAGFRHLYADDAADLLALLEPLAAAMGCRLVRLCWQTTPQGRVLQAMAESSARTSLSLDECADLSRAFSAALDAEDPIEGSYALEVSSPGLARPLCSEEDFAAHQGKRVKVELFQPQNGRYKFSSVELARVTAAEVVLRDGGDEWTIAAPQIKSASLVTDHDAVRAALRTAKRARKTSKPKGE